MMQSTEIPPFIPFAHRARTWPAFHTPKQPMPPTGDATCMEQLLVHCANAIETSDATLAQQILWVLHNIAPPDGDSGQRLTAAFLRALISRATRTGNLLAAVADAAAASGGGPLCHKFSVIELATFVDLTPWHRFGFTAANAAVLEAVGKHRVVHVVDLSLTHCMQIPTLIDSLSSRPDGPPLVRMTVAGSTEDYPPMLDLSYDELGSRLVNFARSRNVAMEFRVVPSSSADGFSAMIDHLALRQQLARIENNDDGDDDEALVINCHMLLHYVPEETPSGAAPLLRTMFLKSLRSLNPTVVVLVDEDADFTSNDFVSRLRSAYNYLWIPYDAVDSLVPKGSKQRQWYEADMCWKIENVVSHEGPQRVERLETKGKWVQRMRDASFRGIAFSEDAITQVKSMLDEHAAGWGLKKEEDEHLLLTWKGNNAVFATAWIPVV